MVLTIAFASSTVYESGMRTTLTSTSTSTSTSTVTATSVSTTTTTSTVDLVKALRDAYLSHIRAIESRNATALTGQYEVNATLMGAVPRGVSSSFDGVANITRFYEEAPSNSSQAVSCLLCLALKTPFGDANETLSMTVSGDDRAGNVTSHLIFYGTDSVGGCYFPNIGPCKAVIYIMGFDISYVLQGDRWLISTESLTYFNSHGCLTFSLSNDGSVVTCTGI